MAISSVESGAPPRVLCIAPRWLGDAILARPALAWLGERGFDLELWVRGEVARVLDDLPGVRAVHVVSGAGRTARLRDALRLRRRDFAAALVLPPSFSSAFAARLTGARHRIGHATDGRSWLLDRRVVLPARDVHLAVQDLQLASLLAAALGRTRGSAEVEPAALPQMPLLTARPAELEAAAQLLAVSGIGREPYLVVAPGARFGAAKRYPPERFAAAAQSLSADHGWRVLLVGAAADIPATAAVRAALPGAIDVAGRTGLAALVGLLAGARGVLANDSGSMHLAAALGRPVVGVFGSTNPRWTSPLGPRVAVIVEPVWCAPCYEPTCKQDFACMLGIDASRLVGALEAELRT